MAYNAAVNPAARRILRLTSLPLILAGLLGLDPRGAGADDDIGPATTLPTPQAAREEAQRRGVPILALVGIPRKECPPVARLEDLLLTGEALARVREVAVPSRLVMAAPASEAEFRAFRERYGDYPQPALFILAADGDLLHAQVGGLYGVYDHDLTPLGSPAVPLLAEAELRALVTAAVARDRQQRERLAATVKGGDAAIAVERGEILASRARAGEALTEARRAVQAKPGPELGVRLARLLHRLGAAAEAVPLLKALKAAHPTAPDALFWGVLLHGYDREQAGSERLVDLASQAQAAKLTAVAALAQVYAALPDDTARAALEVDPAPLEGWAAALAGLPYEGELALGELANRAVGPRSRLRIVELLLEHLPDSRAAQHGKHGMLGLLRMRVQHDAAERRPR